MDMQYKNVGIPKALADRFDKIQRYYGYRDKRVVSFLLCCPLTYLARRSFSEFVVSQIRSGIAILEVKHDLVEFEKKEKSDHE